MNFFKSKTPTATATPSTYADCLNNRQEEIMKYCLGDNWRYITISESREMFNLKLGLNVTPNTSRIDGLKIILKKYEWLFCYERPTRAVLTEKTHKLLR